MKKYLLIGLVILIGTNVIALSGVAYNRLGDSTAQLTLTERELSLPYNIGAQKENSGITLSILWRTPTGIHDTYYPYQSKEIIITEKELTALGFDKNTVQEKRLVASRELFWAFEFNGDLRKAELQKAKDKHREAVTTYEEQENDINKRMLNESNERLEQEKTTHSRLFFLQASAHYQHLANTLSDKPNVLIVKGLSKPYYNQKDKTYHLRLMRLSVGNIMVPLEYASIFTQLKHENKQNVPPSRFAVNIKWGKRLEPWVEKVTALDE